MTQPLEIEVEGLVQHYGLRPVLQEVSFVIPQGSCVAVLGPNASGKTTLLETIGGMLHPWRGSVRIGGLVRRGSVEGERAIRERCVYLPVDAWMPPTLTVREFLVGVGQLYGLPLDTADPASGRPLYERVEAVADLFDLTSVLDAGGSSLSSGQSRKVQLAAASLPETKTLVLDEPFSGGLDPAGIVALKKVLRHLTRTEGRTVLFSIPVPQLLDGLVDRVIVLGDGRVTLDATPAVIIAGSESGTLADALTTLAFADAATAADRFLMKGEDA